MPETMAMQPVVASTALSATKEGTCRVAVLWIDWYTYHVARFRGLNTAPTLAGRVAGIELVGGVGVHAGLKFREEMPADVRVETILPDGSWGTASKVMLAQEVWRRLGRLNPEVVLVPGYYTLPALMAAAWAKMHGRTSVLMTESTAGDHARAGWKERLKSWLIRGLFDWAVTGGRAHVRYLRQLEFPMDRVARYYDVVDNRLYSEGTARLRGQGAASFGLPNSYFLYVGRLAEEKSVAGLLESWLRYRADGGTWSLVLAGDGPEREKLQQLAAESAFAVGVHFLGHKDSRELLQLYSFAECFVLPSWREPWGLVVNEAMASGLPVIVSSRCGCAEDLVQAGENGFVFDPEASGDELSFLLGRMEALGPGRRRGMGDKSRQAIWEYSPESFGLEIAHIADYTAVAKRSAQRLGVRR